MVAEARSIYSGQVRRALERLERQMAEGGTGGTGDGVNEVTIGGSSPTDTSELWVDSTPALYAKIGGTWTPVSGPAGTPGAPGAPGPDEVWVGPAIPTNSTIELWYDTDAIPSGPYYVHNQGTPEATWVIDHDLGWYPNVTVEDSGGSTVEGEVVYTSADSLTLTFSAAFGGVAYLS